MELARIASGILAVVYGLANLMQGVVLLRLKEGVESRLPDEAHRIPVGARLTWVVAGATLVTAGGLLLYGASIGVTLLLAGLIAVHILAIINGMRMFGRINPAHHLVRLGGSVVVAGLALWGIGAF